ncbi:hypothetical protein M514_19672 [Trichuris suis]|uniref:Reverse transcriptase domain-containing protein n=1 Tax=Trichuris suis TaxID=68888 RepID=A0A085NFE4_9BILA|nr:hypothetical protein M514_19672 [Trichuris suis]
MPSSLKYHLLSMIQLYINNVKQLLDTASYKPIQLDPTDNVRKKLKTKLTRYAEETKEEQLINFTKLLKYSSNTKCPELYCLPKIHKPGNPFRPIISNVGSATSGIGSYVSRIIRPLTGNKNSSTLNSKEFVRQIREIELQEDDMLVSYDVKDLFTSIPLSYTYNIIFEALDTDSSLKERTKLNPYHIVDLIKFCMTEGNYFHFQGEHFSQTQGAPMGSPLSPVLAEFFMEHLEQRAFACDNFTGRVKFFKRYVDDIFAIVKKGHEESFLHHLNGLFTEHIKFTIEKEHGGRLPFLDALVIKDGHKLKTTVYRKQTNTDRYLNYHSHHPKSVKIGIVTGMVDRAFNLCDAEFLDAELKDIKRSLIRNDYPRRLVDSCVGRRLELLRSGAPHAQPAQDIRITMPYYTGIAEAVKRLSATIGFQACFTSSTSLAAMLRSDKVKIPTEEQQGAVYNVNCTCGASYIGETGNTISHRFQQHIGNLKTYRTAEKRKNGEKVTTRGQPQKKDPDIIMNEALKTSAVAEHAVTCRKTEKDLSVSKVCRETNYQRRKIREAFYIRHNPNINRDEGSEVSEAWIPISDLTECFTITNRPHTFTHSRGSEGTRSRGTDLPDNTPTAPGHTPT